MTNKIAGFVTVPTERNQKYNTVLSRKAVGKKRVGSASDNPERYCGYLLGHG